MFCFLPCKLYYIIDWRMCQNLMNFSSNISRFVIRKTVVRKDLIQSLPLPRRLLDYLSYKNCYSEQVESDSSQSQVSYFKLLFVSTNIDLVHSLGFRWWSKHCELGNIFFMYISFKNKDILLLFVMWLFKQKQKKTGKNITDTISVANNFKNMCFSFLKLCSYCSSDEENVQSPWCPV